MKRASVRYTAVCEFSGRAPANTGRNAYSTWVARNTPYAAREVTEAIAHAGA
jgi:hypothetical protein